jgi:probable O-glycosylation ligase (exosortase A-associated)
VLALASVGAFLLLRSRNRVAVIVLVLATIALLVPFMPERWEDRMRTIQTYQEDASAMSRLTTWETAFNVAKDMPLGAGLEYYSPEISAKYSPDPTDFRVAHSIYFQVLGSQGFVGLGLYLLFWALVWGQCNTVRRLANGRIELGWAHGLASACQASLVGFLVGAAFLDLAFWDVPYYMFAAIAVTKDVLVREASQATTAAESVVGGMVRPSESIAEAVERRRPKSLSG